MKKFIDEYIVDYRNSEEKHEDLRQPETRPVKIRSKKYISGILSRKLLAVVTMFILMTTIIYSVFQSKETPVFFSSATIDENIRRYDDFIFPVVMQDPEPFEAIEEANPFMLISASLWRLVINKRIDEFDTEGLSIVNAEEMWENYEILFGNKFYPELSENLDTDFFSFDKKENKFHIKPCSNQACYIPYTESYCKNGEIAILRVGYVSPNDKWRSLKSDRPKHPKPVKTIEYSLNKTGSDQNSKYICAIRRI